MQCKRLSAIQDRPGQETDSTEILGMILYCCRVQQQKLKICPSLSHSHVILSKGWVVLTPFRTRFLIIGLCNHFSKCFHNGCFIPFPRSVLNSFTNILLLLPIKEENPRSVHQKISFALSRLRGKWSPRQGKVHQKYFPKSSFKLSSGARLFGWLLRRHH